MKRALLAGLLFVALLAPASASAHPLGNFSINHLVTVSVSSDRVDLRYVLDQAEIPTFQERGLPHGAALERKRAEVRRGLHLIVDGSEVRLAQGAAALSSPPGQGGLPLTRLELPLRAAVHAPHRVEVHDDTFPDRVGWKAIVARPGTGTAVRSSAPSGDPTGGLRHYPQDKLSSPLAQRTATLAVARGDGTLTAPKAPGGPATTNRSGDGLTGIFEDAAAGRGALILLILAAFAWGAVHALSPGHGKTMVAAYLVGTRGTARHAIGLGATVTVTHTLGVFALGAVALLLAQYVLPEDLYPWLSLASALLVLGIGATVLRKRLRARKRHSHHHHHHHHDDGLSKKGIVAMGASAGLLPCPSALVVLLAALAQHQVPLGLGLIVVFSLGLAATLTGLGLVVVYAQRLSAKLRVPGRVVAVLPAVSSLAIVAIGIVMTAKALPQVA
ncbi:MAG: sulfite exporter TauE/SafE family protein [Solirubrobacteraceae bacterium]